MGFFLVLITGISNQNCSYRLGPHVLWTGKEPLAHLCPAGHRFVAGCVSGWIWDAMGGCLALDI